MGEIVSRVHLRLFGSTVMIAIAASLYLLEAEQGSSIRSDEHIMFFPTFAVQGNGASWTAHVHGWIYESETGAARDELSRALAKLIAQRFGLSRQTLLEDSVEAAQHFERRAAPFFVDNERGKRIAVTVAGASGTTEESEKNGHFAGTVALPAGAGTAGEWVNVRAALPGDDARNFAGKVQLIPRAGVTVVSDIDDTIKHSEVRDKVQLGLNTFAREFRATPGTAALYQRWARGGGQVVFHYVSGSPFQLFSDLAEFAQRAGFPEGSFHLRPLRLKDASAAQFFGDPKAFKLATIRPIIDQFKDRRFILVGDSGEHDPEVYATLATEFPNVDAIIIRNVTNETLESPRYTKLFAGLPARVQRRVFRETSELDGFTPR
jgi:phosphatidate phosphatase APP1